MVLLSLLTWAWR
ncbi:hypothetical protein SKAU_G00237360 [Synaphobranchus kaupii]|uniref:Uncharacterized protein n=1 Tax=Synaphobranchus kaupii TaxID=118154 RepID=A0A9Q1F716_SYNKA|nr:hypothetical protein SKAU_G00237360 [Synaphobranchus kaupii]